MAIIRHIDLGNSPTFGQFPGLDTLHFVSADRAGFARWRADGKRLAGCHRAMSAGDGACRRLSSARCPDWPAFPSLTRAGKHCHISATTRAFRRRRCFCRDLFRPSGCGCLPVSAGRSRQRRELVARIRVHDGRAASLPERLLLRPAT